MFQQLRGAAMGTDHDGRTGGLSMRRNLIGQSRSSTLCAKSTTSNDSAVGASNHRESLESYLPGSKSGLILRAVRELHKSCTQPGGP